MIRAKLAQSVGILEELGIDLWMIFTRESANVHDPCIDLVVGGNVTWASAFLIGRGGQRIAILGSLDKAAHEELANFDEIIPYVQGISEPLRETLARLDPSRIAINFSRVPPTQTGWSRPRTSWRGCAPGRWSRSWRASSESARRRWTSSAR